MATELWHLDKLNELLSETIDTLESMDSSGLLANRINEIRKEIGAFPFDEKSRYNLWMTTDSGKIFMLDEKTDYSQMSAREMIFLQAMMGIVATELVGYTDKVLK